MTPSGLIVDEHGGAGPHAEQFEGMPVDPGGKLGAANLTRQDNRVRWIRKFWSGSEPSPAASMRRPVSGP
jgi:hypothetical protein